MPVVPFPPPNDKLYTHEENAIFSRGRGAARARNVIIIIIIIMAQLGIQQKTDIDAENKINNELEESFET